MATEGGDHANTPAVVSLCLLMRELFFYSGGDMNDFQWLGDTAYKPTLAEGKIARVAIFVAAVAAGLVAVTQLFGIGERALAYFVWAYLISTLIAQVWFGIALVGAARNLEYFTSKRYRPILFGLIYIGPMVIILGWAMFIAARHHFPLGFVTAVYDYAYYPFMFSFAIAWFVAPFFVHRIHRDSVRLTAKDWTGKSAGSVAVFYALMYCSSFLSPAYAEKFGVNPAIASPLFAALGELMLQQIVTNIVTAQELAAKDWGLRTSIGDGLVENDTGFRSLLRGATLRFAAAAVVVVVILLVASDLYRIAQR